VHTKTKKILTEEIDTIIIVHFTLFHHIAFFNFFDCFSNLNAWGCQYQPNCARKAGKIYVIPAGSSDLFCLLAAQFFHHAQELSQCCEPVGIICERDAKQKIWPKELSP
jgi:hypothetical protein